MDLFGFVKSNVDILNVVNDYTALKKAGLLYWKGKCPFHHEKTGSFTVSPHKNIFYCFGCHVTGDVINFIEKIENITPLQAAEHLIDKFHLDIPQELKQHTKTPLSKTHYQICFAFASWCQNMLLKHPQALNYLLNRKITKPTINHFMLGFFPTGNRAIQDLIEHLTKQGFNSQDLINTHILMQGKHGLYSAYENRIIFPIKEHLGQICGFGGRIFMANDTRAKYYNSMDSVYFKKGKILFGLDSAKQEIQKQHTVIFVEGYMDCIALWQVGFKQTVATLGTACSADHLQNIAKYASTIYLLYDADNAGIQAVLRLAASCWHLDLDIKVIALPAGQDPASMLEQNLVINEYIDQAQDLFTFYVNQKSSQFFQESIKYKISLLQDLFDIIKQTKDTLKESILMIKINETLQIPLDILKIEYTKKNNTLTNTTQLEQLPSESEPAIIMNPIESQIIAAIAYNPNLLSEKYELLLTTGLQTTALEIVQAYINHRNTIHQQEPCSCNTEVIVDQKYKELIRSEMFKLQQTITQQDFESLMMQFQKKYWKSIISTIKVKITQATKQNNKSEVQRLLTFFEQLKLEIYKGGRL